MQKVPAAAVWGLGLTQIVGYGTIFYSFSILAPAMARDFGWPEQWIFGALSVSLLISGVLSPTAGRLADRYGAARAMSIGSVAAALSLLACAGAPGPIGFAAALVAMQIATCFIFYSTAFVVIVQLGDRSATRSITHLTLIAGFASTLFWPITIWLHAELSWREVYVLFAFLNVALCLPIHLWLTRLPRTDTRPVTAPLAEIGIAVSDAVLDKRTQATAFVLMLAGFAVEGLILSAVLIHMVPLMTTLGLGTAGLIVSTLFGPAQVASRFVNMLFGGGLPQRWLAVIAASLLPAGLFVLLISNPSMPGAIVFAILFGLGSGLTSIVGGTLPLELFGREGYGSRIGWVTAARQFTSALAPFALSWMIARTGAVITLSSLIAVGGAGLVAFAAIVVRLRRSEQASSGGRSVRASA